MSVFPDQSQTHILFSHTAYQMAECFAQLGTGLSHEQAWTHEETLARLPQADVLVISGFWDDVFLEHCPRLRYIQSIGAGYDQFPLEQLRERGILLANATGVNADAVSQHAMGLVLGLIRQLHSGRDNQRRRFWRSMISNIPDREDDLVGHTLLIIGLGAIGERLARLAKAFGMTVIGVKRDAATHQGQADEVHTPAELSSLLARADFVALCCPLTADTRRIIDAAALRAMKPSAYLINVARGGCVHEPALLDALSGDWIAGAAIDHFDDEPLPESSPFWSLDNLIITPHTGGETRKYENNVIEILRENLARLWSGNTGLRNQIV